LYEVEAVADEVAILHDGRIARHADTESLRRDVKRFVLDRAALAAVRDDLALLEMQAAGEQVAVTVENASAIGALLEREGLPHRIVDLNLDEIFTAYVAGPRAKPATNEPAPELAPQA
jgi:ABC-type multidrug transport system ATPase subunit